MYPELGLFISSLTALSPLPNPLILCGITLPLLLHLPRHQTPHEHASSWTRLLSLFGILVGASTLSYLPTTFGSLPGVEAILLQGIFSGLASAAVLIPILGYQHISHRFKFSAPEQANEGPLISLSGDDQGRQAEADNGERKSRSPWLELALFPLLWTSW